MTITNAIKKLSKYGEVREVRKNEYEVSIQNHIVSFLTFDGVRVDCEQVRRIGDNYRAGTYVSSLDSAIQIATGVKI